MIGQSLELSSISIIMIHAFDEGELLKKRVTVKCHI